MEVEKLTYTSDDIITSVLPEDAQEEIPVGFAIVGHVGMYSPRCDPITDPIPYDAI